MFPDGPPDLSNPFLQFVDPMLYRSLVDEALKRSETGRRIRLLAISQTEPRPSGRGARYAAAPLPARQPFWRDKESR